MTLKELFDFVVTDSSSFPTLQNNATDEQALDAYLDKVIQLHLDAS